MSERKTIADIALEAGVSTATVGRVLKNKGYVSQDARMRVEAAVKKYNYIPNSMARALRKDKSGLIGILVVENQGNLYQKINTSIMAAAEQTGYQVITLESRLQYRDEAYLINQFVGMRVDGLVIVSNIYITEELLERLYSLSIPTVMVERSYDKPYIDNIIIRNREGIYDATCRLLNKGHRKIAFFGADFSLEVEKMRLKGFREAMKEAGILEKEQTVCLLDSYRPESGRQAMEELLKESSLPTAVICGADTLASGVMQALYQANKRVPEDISVVGCDNVLAANLAPAIDSIEPDLQKAGECVMRLLCRRMDDFNCASATEYLDMIYVERESVLKL